MVVRLEQIEQVDSTGQLEEVLGLAEHLRDALWRVESAGLSAREASGGLLISGMGGSGIGGRLASGAIGARARAPIAVSSGYRLPPWTRRDTLVLCSSYSGNTEETLATYDEARAIGAARVVATTGGALAERARADGVPVVPLPAGFQPRHAVGYSTVVALECARMAGAAPDLRDEVEAAAAALDDHPHDAAAELAERLHATVPVFYGADLTGPLAYRWKCQLNENAKQPAFWAELPEADHNEVCAWAAAEEMTAVFLEDPGMHPRNAARLAITREMIGVNVAVPAAGGEESPPLARLMLGVHLGDLTSLYCAALRGVDPVAIDAIDALKARLG
jgi:glucose/mannose-6-phosphate isomerase